MIRAEGLATPYFLIAAGTFVLVMVALGLARIFFGPSNAERMMAAQLFGTGGIAVLLLIGAGTGVRAAVDVALTLALLTAGVLLLGASARLRGTEKSTGAERAGVARHVLAAVLCTLVSVGLAVIVLILPQPAPTLAPSAAANLAATGLGNPVAGVLLAYRALDTLLESAVLPLALIGVWSLASDRFWGGRPGLRLRPNREGVLVFLAQLLTPFGVLMGIYIVWVGADAPGGKFQGGTILAAMWILTMMAGITDTPPISRLWLRIVLIAGPLVFLAVGLAGFAVPGTFLAYPTRFAKPLILIVEAALTPSIAASLGLLIAGPPERIPNG